MVGPRIAIAAPKRKEKKCRKNAKKKIDKKIHKQHKIIKNCGRRKKKSQPHTHTNAKKRIAFLLYRIRLCPLTLKRLSFKDDDKKNYFYCIQKKRKEIKIDFFQSNIKTNKRIGIK